MTRLPCGGQVGHPRACTSTPRCCAGLHGLPGPEERVLRGAGWSNPLTRSDTEPTFWEREGLFMHLVWAASPRSLCQVPRLLPCARHLGCEQATVEAFLSLGCPSHSLRVWPLLIGKVPKFFLMECSGVQERPQAWQTQSQMIAVDSL